MASNRILFSLSLLLFLAVSVGFSQETTAFDQYSDQELIQLINKDLRTFPQKAIDASYFLLERSKKENNLENQCLALSFIGKANRVLAKLDQSLDYQLQAKDLLKQIKKPQIKVAVFNALGNTYSDLGEYDKVLPNYFKAIEIADKNELFGSKVSLRSNLAYFKNQIGEYDDAISLLKEGKKLLLASNEPKEKIDYLLFKNDLLMTMVFFSTKQPDSIIQYSNRAFAYPEKESDRFSLQGMYSFRGAAHTQKKEYNKALYYIKIADSMGQLLGNDIVLMDTKYALADVYYNLKDYSKSIQILEEAVAVTEKKDLNYPLNDDIYYLLAKAYKATGDYEKASSNSDKYIAKLEVNRQKKSIIENDFDSKQIKNFQEELNQLRDEKEHQQNNIIYLAVAGGIAISTLLILLVLSKKRDQQRFKALLKEVEETKRGKQAIIDTKDKELEEKSAADVNQETTQLILEGLKKMEEQEFFLKQDCNAYTIAKKIKTNTTYLSKVVNASFQKNFNTYINDLRINYAIVRLKEDSRFRSFSVQSIANELGYKSADSFSKYFKKHTGLLPSFYIKKLNSLD